MEFEPRKAKGRTLCPMKDSDTPFGDSVLAAVVPQEVFDEYLQIRSLRSRYREWFIYVYLT